MLEGLVGQVGSYIHALWLRASECSDDLPLSSVTAVTPTRELAVPFLSRLWGPQDYCQCKTPGTLPPSPLPGCIDPSPKSRRPGMTCNFWCEFLS